MIRKILRTKLPVGFVIEGKIIKKDVNYIAGYRSFKVDKKDGWIEIRDNETLEKWAIFKRFSYFGYLYMGFCLGRRPFAFYIPSKEAKKDIRQAILSIKRKYRFLKIDWTLRGGSATAPYYHIQTDIIDLFRFINFLKPIPADVEKIISRIDYPEIIVQRLYAEIYNVNRVNMLKGNAIYREVLLFFTGSVLKVKFYAYPVLDVKVKYQVCGGYISACAKLGVIKNVLSRKLSLIQVNLQSGLKVLLQKTRRCDYDRKDQT